MSNEYKLVPVELLERLISATRLARGEGSPTQRDAEALLAAPQPPALGGEHGAIVGSLERFESDGEDYVRLHDVRDAVQVIIVPLQSEIERLKNIDHRQILAESAAKYLLDSGAENFVGDVFTIQADDGVTKFEIIVTTQRAGGKSPHEVCSELKAQRAELERLSSEASEWIKANSFHGTDAIDLWERIDAALSKPPGSEQ